MEQLLFSLNATIPVFLVMVIGYVLQQLHVTNDSFVKTLNSFNYKITLPVLLFKDMSTADFYSVWDTGYVLFCFFVTLFCIIITWVVAGIFYKNKSRLGELVQASYRSSAAVLGIAFIQNIYGNSGMAPLMILGSVPLFNIFAVIILTVESPQQHGKVTPSKLLYGVLTNPILDGIILGTLYSLLTFGLPTLAQKTLTSLSSLTTPLALLSIGASFEGAKAIKKLAPTLVAACCKLMVLTTIFIPIAVKLGFRDQQLIALLIMLGRPTTPSSYVMAKNMGDEGVLTASCVAATTLFSALSLTFWIFVLRSGGYIA